MPRFQTASIPNSEFGFNLPRTDSPNLCGQVFAWVMKVPSAIPVDWIVLGMVLYSVVGIVFGTYPAGKTANLDPIESLLFE
jgi:ABC-type antimicrobial peptide transport system permease subunit